MYDQPVLFESPLDFPGGEATVQAELKGMRIAPVYTDQVKAAREKPKRKRKREKSLRDIARRMPYTPAQVIMREEITGIKQIEAELLNKQIPQAAQAIINEYDDFTLTGAQWQVVQQMVESGIRAGLAIPRSR